MRQACLAALLALALVTSASAATMSINSWDPGGQIHTYEMWWKRIAALGVTVRVNGPCVSACTMMLWLVPKTRVCITPRAKFGIHMVSVDDVPNRRATRSFVKNYPAWVKAWLKTKPRLTDDLTWLYPKDIGNNLKRCK